VVRFIFFGVRVMSLFNALYRLVGRAGARPDSKPDLSLGPLCPDEAEIFIYTEGRTSSRKRAELEGHFADCRDCRELLALVIKIPDQEVEGYDAHLTPLSEDGVKKQTARVLAFIENDERRRQPAPKQPARPVSVRKRDGIYVPYPVLAGLAMIICAIGAGAMFWLTRDHSPETAMDALRLAVKEDRRTPARISGGLAHSPYLAPRGEGGDVLQFERAISKLKHAESESAPVEARLALARVYLALGKDDEANKALTILEQLVARGNQSPEIFNDLGVAQFQLEHYGDAIADFTKALEKSPGYGEALFNRALAYERENSIEAAKQDWQEFIRLNSDEKWKAEAQSHLDLLPSIQDRSKNSNPLE
jgi:tetratricopeptide (TPR) repeat protein